MGGGVSEDGVRRRERESESGVVCGGCMRERDE